VHFYRGNRQYNQIAKDNSHWIWNYDFRAIPGELFFSKDELRFGEKVGNDFVLVEPNLPPQKKSSPNKDWGFPKYIALVDRLKKAGLEVAQLVYAEGRRLPGVKKVHTPNFRLALAALRQAQIYVGPEGGLHHASAALGVKATVLFGGFVPPQVTGYEFHTNLTGGAEACGSITPCAHCKAAMAKIDVDEVFGDVLRRVAGPHDIRMDGMLDLVIRARGASVFDIGMNRGLVGYEFANNGATMVHGCDNYVEGVYFARELFADLRNCQTKFEVVDLTERDAMRVFGNQRYDIVLMLATYHKLKRIMQTSRLSALMTEFGQRTVKWFAWRGTSEKANENEAEIIQIDKDMKAAGLTRIHTSYISQSLGVCAIWERK
jgi:hypothetical protein